MPKFELFDKEAALENALNLFWEKGYNGTSIRDLEKVMNLGKSSIYNTFGDKDSLFFAALKHYMNFEQARISGSITSSGNALAAIRSLFGCVIHPPQFRGKLLGGCLLVDSFTELSQTKPAVKRFAEDAKAATLELLKMLIGKAQQEGDIPASKKSADLALYLFNNMQGLKVTGLLVKNPKDLAPVVDTILKSLTCA
jgi:TetR/AcrR family transcriptional repressor of nem operon